MSDQRTSVAVGEDSVWRNCLIFLSIYFTRLEKLINPFFPFLEIKVKWKLFYIQCIVRKKMMKKSYCWASRNVSGEVDTDFVIRHKDIKKYFFKFKFQFYT